jgi:hypothetical protein
MVCGLQTTKGHIMTGNRPTLIAYSVKERGKGKKAIWTRIGAAWPFEGDTKGFTIQLDALPLCDRIVLAEPKPEADGESAQ